MPRFDQNSVFDHRADNELVLRKDLRFLEQDVAEDFAIAQYLTDYIPRSVIRGISGRHIVLENPEHLSHPNEVFFVNSMPNEG